MTHAAHVEARVRAQLAATQAHWPVLAAGLWAMKETRAWEAVGLDSFKAWLGQPDVSMSYRSAQELVALHDHLVVERGVRPDTLGETTPGKLAVVLPAVKDESVPVDEALADAVALSRADLIAKYREGNAPHERATCPTCGSKVRKEKVG